MNHSRQRTLRFFQWIFFTSASLLLAYCALVLTSIFEFQRRELHGIDSISSQPASIAVIEPRSIVGLDGLVGRIEIKRIGLSTPIVEGTGSRSLLRSAGHIAGTSFPGDEGNIGIAGHRDTLFRPLRHIRLSDLITLTTHRGVYRYRVVSTKVVRPSDISVLNSDGDQFLTLVTCYPFGFIGPAPSRFIVRAERVLE